MQNEPLTALRFHEGFVDFRNFESCQRRVSSLMAATSGLSAPVCALLCIAQPEELNESATERYLAARVLLKNNR